jgi:two-component system chemotaxis response regulator CheB
MKRVRALIIDDSSVVRQLLTQILNETPDIEVIGTAEDPYEAREKIKKLAPDVLTLDVEMPKMNGVSFLKNLMRLHPLPVVMISTLTEKGADVTLQALEIGAIDFVAKPRLDLPQQLNKYTTEIIEKVRAAANVNINAVLAKKAIKINEQGQLRGIKEQTSRTIKKVALAQLRTDIDVIAIGASTGGTEAIKQLLSQLPVECPGIVIVQHLPAEFSIQYARRVNQMSDIQVSVAQHNKEIVSGHAYIAPGDKHLLIEERQGRYYCQLKDGEEVKGHKPSVDVLFNSIAEQAGGRAIGIILTGMGSDGAEGLLAMKQAGGRNLAQDEKSSVVWGMPMQALKLDAVHEQVPITHMAEKLIAYLT